jgi:hypothetical protein
VWPFRKDPQPTNLYSWLAEETAKEALRNPPWPPPERPDAAATILGHIGHLLKGAPVSDQFLSILSPAAKTRWLGRQKNPAEALSALGTPPCVTTYLKSGASFERLGGSFNAVLSLAENGDLSGPSRSDGPTIDVVEPPNDQGPSFVFVNVNGPVDARPVLEPRQTRWNAPLLPVQLITAGYSALLGAAVSIISLGASFIALAVPPSFEAAKGPVGNSTASIVPSSPPTNSQPTQANKQVSTHEWFRSIHRLVDEGQQMMAKDGKLDVDALIRSAQRVVEDMPADLAALSLLSVAAGLTTGTFWGRDRYNHALRERNLEAITPMASIVEGIRDLHWLGTIQPGKLTSIQHSAWEALFSVRCALMNPPADLRSLEAAERIANETLARLVKPNLLRLAESAMWVAKAKPAKSEGLDQLIYDLLHEVRFWLGSVPQEVRPSVSGPPPATLSIVTDQMLGRPSSGDTEQVHAWLNQLAGTLRTAANALTDAPHPAVRHLRKERFEDRIHMYWTLTALVIAELSRGESSTASTIPS